MKLDEIEGIGPAYAEKLHAAGLTTVEQLLEQAGTAAGRKTLAERFGVSSTFLLEWVNHADLCRVSGVGGEYADLLEEAGVDTVPELAQRNAANLGAALERRVPSESEIARWVEQAKTLPRMVEH